MPNALPGAAFCVSFHSLKHPQESRRYSFAGIAYRGQVLARGRPPIELLDQGREMICHKLDVDILIQGPGRRGVELSGFRDQLGAEVEKLCYGACEADYR